MCVDFQNPESARKNLRTLIKKEMVVLENSPSLETKKTWRFEGQRKETWIYTQPAWLLIIRERMLESYSD